MSNLDAVILTIIGSTIAIILGYILNGWRERDFERRKTNYHSKLTAFMKINEAMWGLGSAYVYLRMMLSIAEEPPEDEAALGETLMLAALSHDLEEPLGTSISHQIIDKLNSIGAIPNGKPQEDALTSWTLGARGGLIVLYVRVLLHHAGKLAKAGSDALLVAETPSVQEAVGKLLAHLEQKFNEIPLTLINESRTGAGAEPYDLKKITGEMTPLFDNLQSAMQDELSETML